MLEPAHDLVTVGVRGNQGSAGGRIIQAECLVGQQGRDGFQAGVGQAASTRALDAVSPPDTVHVVIRDRVDRVDGDACEVLRVAAVIGRDFARRILERIYASRARLPASECHFHPIGDEIRAARLRTKYTKDTRSMVRTNQQAGMPGNRRQAEIQLGHQILQKFRG